MCGIVGYVGRRHAMPILLEGLSRLEYRGYDSAGIALQRKDRVEVLKKQGRLAALRAILPKRNAATTGIGHTRWATHGEPSDSNAHPHQEATGKVTIVHNGIIENADALRAYLAGEGHTFASETDSEVVAALIAEVSKQVPDLLAATQQALTQVVGTYGLVVLHTDHPGELVVARNGSPVILGMGDGEMLVASDAAALAPFTSQVMYLEDGEVARLTAREHEIRDMDTTLQAREVTTLELGEQLASRGEFAHFTLKEIHEQPEVLARVMQGRVDPRFGTARFGGLDLEPRELMSYRRIKLLGCGSALISASIGASVIEQLARIPADAESAAEFRYRNPIIEADTLYLAVSQSGETYDTLAAVQEIRRKGGTVLGVVNVVGSTIARECGRGIYLHAGPEVAVVSTKTFTATIAALVLLALFLGRMKDLSPAAGGQLLAALGALPERIHELLSREAEFREIAVRYAAYDRAYFIGRGIGYGLAHEGALKLKEISYIHAEAYPASELKHGPLALVDERTPTFALLPHDELLAKNHATIAEIRTRKGPVVAIGDCSNLALVDDAIQVDPLHPALDALLLLIPLQFLAYYSALAREADVDRPRNLAKSVTVE